MISPKRLIIEYEDGSRKVTEFTQLDNQTWLELSRSGLCPPPPKKTLDHYVLMRWKDGWQEVVGISKMTAELWRYYTLERTEEVGRMAFDVAEDYPLLFLVKRLPRQIESLFLVGRKGSKGYTLEEKRAVKEGDKIEHILYDKKDSSPCERAEGWVAEIKEQLKAEMKKKGLTSEQLLSLDDHQKLQAYFDFAKALGIRGMEKQEDVYGFIQLMAENLLASKE
ncbi:MAG: hypothetical protein A2V86_12975 [Deltaproteobacteria bacterium RBG_16_49_23]|nr:MAG: hypothetical protein A2V86_12975 [Deltaproteobacteria bacterium RBG_16_49_23]